MRLSFSYFLLWDKLSGIKQQPFYYVHDFWDQEDRELRDIQPQMKGFKRLSLVQMWEAKSTQRCLHSLAVSWMLSWGYQWDHGSYWSMCPHQCDCLGFLTTWWLGSGFMKGKYGRSKCPGKTQQKFRGFFWPRLGSHTLIYTVFF